MGMISKKDTLAESPDIIRAGHYAWVIYGLLITVQFTYYADQYYWYYVLSDYGPLAQSFRTQFGTAHWIRETLKVVQYGALLFFWVFTLNGEPESLQLFA